MKPLKTFYIETYGCQMNLNDSERMTAVLQREGLTSVPQATEADVILLNTCSVRAKAEQKVFSRLGLFSLLNKQRPDMILGLCGSIAQEG